MATGTTTATKLIIAGGFQAGYLIADRLGMSVELVPHLFGATNQFPIGQRGLFAIWRTGGDQRGAAGRGRVIWLNAACRRCGSDFKVRAASSARPQCSDCESFDVATWSDQARLFDTDQPSDCSRPDCPVGSPDD